MGDDLEPDALGWSSDVLVQLRGWNREWPGNINLPLAIDEAIAEIERLRAALIVATL